MKCSVPGPNVKVFGKAIHSLSKIGEELYFEPQDDALSVRTVNSSRSAYACFSFKPSFFISYTHENGQANSQGDGDNARCKITMKSCLTVFKSLSNLDKTVDKCKIQLDSKETRLVFQLHCKHGIIKTYNLSFIECDTLQAVFSKNLMPNWLIAQTRLFCDVVVNFQNNQEEMTLCVDPNRVVAKNYIDEDLDPSKVIRSELSLEPEEFEHFQVGVDTEVTFCLKEFRAILSFGELNNLPISIHFEAAGKPVVISFDNDSGFEGDFVLATLADNYSQDASQKPSQMKKSNKSVSHAAPKQSIPNSRLSNQNGHKNHNETSSSHKKPASKSKPASKKDVPETSRRNNFPSTTEDDSPIIPACNRPSESSMQKTSMLDYNDEDDDDDMLPGTPPAKKMKSLFFGWSQSSASQVPTTKDHQVLAEDTDEDD